MTNLATIKKQELEDLDDRIGRLLASRIIIKYATDITDDGIEYDCSVDNIDSLKDYYLEKTHCIV